MYSSNSNNSSDIFEGGSIAKHAMQYATKIEQTRHELDEAFAQYTHNQKLAAIGAALLHSGEAAAASAQKVASVNNGGGVISCAPGCRCSHCERKFELWREQRRQQQQEQQLQGQQKIASSSSSATRSSSTTTSSGNYVPKFQQISNFLSNGY